MLQESSWTIFFHLTSPIINRRSSSFSTLDRRGLKLMDDLGDPTIELNSLSFYCRNHPGSSDFCHSSPGPNHGWKRISSPHINHGRKENFIYGLFADFILFVLDI